MKERASQRRRYIPPSMKLVTYFEASAKIEAEEQWTHLSERLPILVLKAFLLALPLVTLLSCMDPSGFVLHRVLLGRSEVLWFASAIASLSVGLSAEGLLKRFYPKPCLHPNDAATFVLLGLVNCVCVVGVFWSV